MTGMTEEIAPAATRPRPPLGRGVIPKTDHNRSDERARQGRARSARLKPKGKQT